MSYDGLRPPKSGKTRVVPYIRTGIAKIFKDQKNWQRENKEKMWSKYFRSDFIITRKDGTLIDPKLLSRRFGEVQKRNQLDSVRFHDLRHTAASLMILEGVPLKTISDILGHSSISITADIYGHVLEEQKLIALESIIKYLG